MSSIIDETSGKTTPLNFHPFRLIAVGEPVRMYGKMAWGCDTSSTRDNIDVTAAVLMN
jgi:hypothetical protein